MIDESHCFDSIEHSYNRMLGDTRRFINNVPTSVLTVKIALTLTPGVYRDEVKAPPACTGIKVNKK